MNKIVDEILEEINKYLNRINLYFYRICSFYVDLLQSIHTHTHNKIGEQKNKYIQFIYVLHLCLCLKEGKKERFQKASNLKLIICFFK